MYILLIRVILIHCILYGHFYLFFPPQIMATFVYIAFSKNNPLYNLQWIYIFFGHHRAKIHPPFPSPPPPKKIN
jgi:hypothetical protein